MKPEISQGRFAHPDGFQQLACGHGDGDKRFFSAGIDGDGKLWGEDSSNLVDDEPSDFKMGDVVTALTIKNDRIYAGVSGDDGRHAVHWYAYPLAEESHLVVRFQMAVNCIAVDESNEFIAAGSADCDVKWVPLNACTDFRRLSGHSAPVLSVVPIAKRQFLASSSCDGTVRIWPLTGDALDAVHTIDKVHRPTNDRTVGAPLVQLAYHAANDELIVPHFDGVRAYKHGSWTVAKTFTSKLIKSGKHPLSLCVLRDDCLAVSSLAGHIFLFDYASTELRQTLQHKTALSSMIWKPAQSNALIYTDWKGDVYQARELMQDDDVSSAHDEEEGEEEETSPVKRAPAGVRGVDRKPNIFDDDEDSQGGEDDLGAIKKRFGFNEDMEQVGVPTADEFEGMDVEEEYIAGVNDGEGGEEKYQSVARSSPMPKMQPPFVSGSTPKHNSIRFIKYNTVGVISQYVTEEESSVEIAFHDISHHSAFHLGNKSTCFSMGDLTPKAYLLARDEGEEEPSSFTVNHFGAADRRQWTSTMPEGESIVCVALADRYCAVATDACNVRVFTLSGIQLSVWTIGGPLLTMATHGSRLCVTHHRGCTVVDGDSFVAHVAAIEHDLHFDDQRRSTVDRFDMALSPSSTLTWLGYSNQGVLFSADSKGIVRRRNADGTWTPIFDERSMCKSRSDHAWVFAVDDTQAHIRCMFVKGAVCPSLLPKPLPLNEKWTIALCDAKTERTSLEHALLSSRLRQTAVVGERSAELSKEELTALMRLFDLATKAEQESRAIEVGQMMPSSDTVQHLINYANKMRKKGLADKLADVARAKQQREQLDMAPPPPRQAIAPPRTEVVPDDAIVDGPKLRPLKTAIKRKGGDIEADAENPLTALTRSISQTVKREPLAASQQSVVPSSLADESVDVTLTPANPFKRTQNSPTPTQSTNGANVSVFDSLGQQTTTARNNEQNAAPDGKRSKKDVKKQSTLSFAHSRKQTGFQLWVSQYGTQLADDFEQATEGEKESEKTSYNKWTMRQWKLLSNDERKTWTEQAKA